MELSEQPSSSTTWQEIRHALRRALGDSTFAIWIEPLELAAIDGITLVLRGPADTTNWLAGRYGRVLERCARSVLGEGATVRFSTDSGPAAPGATAPPPSSTPATERPALNPRYTFDQFIIGDGNRLAHAAALAVAEQPGQAYTPLFLHAPPGLGKTHLLQAIGNYTVLHGSGTRVRYTTVETFTNDFIAALASKSLERFKHSYRDVDLLLIDDVQFLAKKVKTEEEFFHTFNALQDAGRQIVLTADCLPSQLEGIAERLRERFGAGLVAEIQPPDIHTRVAILRKRAALDGIELTDKSVLQAISERVTDDVRSLEGALIRVVAYHSLTGQPIDLALTRSVLDAMHYPRPEVGRRSTATGQPRQLSLEAVKAAVASYFDLTTEELVSPSRAARIAWPRQLAIHLARELTGASLTTIGAAFGGRNHATVLHACKRVADRASTDQQAAVDIQELTRTLQRTQVGADRSC